MLVYFFKLTVNVNVKEQLRLYVPQKTEHITGIEWHDYRYYFYFNPKSLALGNLINFNKLNMMPEWHLKVIWKVVRIKSNVLVVQRFLMRAWWIHLLYSPLICRFTPPLVMSVLTAVFVFAFNKKPLQGECSVSKCSSI